MDAFQFMLLAMCFPFSYFCYKSAWPGSDSFFSEEDGYTDEILRKGDKIFLNLSSKLTIGLCGFLFVFGVLIIDEILKIVAILLGISISVIGGFYRVHQITKILNEEISSMRDGANP